MRSFVLFLTFSLGLSLPCSAAEPRQSPAPHSHGESLLNIAVDGNNLTIELEAPADDIIGFEHKPATPQERQTVAQAKAALSQPLTLFTLPEESQCRQTAAKVEFSGDDVAGVKAPASTHAEFRAEYSFNCRALDRLTALKFPFFKVFKRAQTLQVNFIGANGQAAFEATRSRPYVTLTGTN